MTHLIKVKIQSIKNQTWVADKCCVADSFLSRFKGLMGVSKLEDGEGLLLKPCNDIHMWFMKIPIDVVFLDKGEIRHGVRVAHVTSLRENFRPWSLFPQRDAKAADTLELPIGTIKRCDIQVGDELCIS